ncbi:hypothetical protein [Baekduia sp.]|uniref:TolB family protein n=1 Tax=Baekduia sp. TaxID=2600305 RepID=UPI002DFB3A11|nr:hypothetical protein [Baekduia sp.]
MTAALLCAVAFAGQAAAALPDGRAYEKVSPADKSDQGVSYDHSASSSSGNTIAFAALSAFGDSQVGSMANQYVATREPDGWNVRSVFLPQGPIREQVPPPSTQRISGDAAKFVVSGSVAGLPGIPPGVVNLYARNGIDGSARLITTAGPPPPAPTYTPFFGAASTDFNHVAFTGAAALLPGAPADHRNVYQWDDGQLQLASILPNGQPAPDGAVVAPDASEPSRRAMSANGSRLFFTAGPLVDAGTFPSPLYLREHGTTTQINASQRTPAVPGDDTATFWTASTDGSQAFFTAGDQLTDDSTAGNGNQDLYRYDAGSGALTDLTPTAGGAQVQGVLGDASEDGSYLYFVALAQLDGTLGMPGTANLYLWHEGDPIRFIATLDALGDGIQWATQTLHQASRAVTPDGRHLVFTSDLSLTSYDSASFTEVYTYDAVEHRLACVSCDPGGGPATGSAEVAAGDSFANMAQSRRTITDDGARVFFDSPDALVNGDTNGTQDVYEWEDNEVHLISDGTSNEVATFADASADGHDVFFTTRARLTPDDTDALGDLYDARVGGGLPQPAAPHPCSDDTCQGSMSLPPPAPVVASIAFSGRGNGPAVQRPAAASVKIGKVAAVRGTKASLRITVNVTGRLAWSGRGLVSGSRKLTRATTSRLTFSLSRSAAKTLAAKRRYKTSLRLTFTPTSGRAATATVSLTFRSSTTARRGK